MRELIWLWRWYGVALSMESVNGIYIEWCEYWKVLNLHVDNVDCVVHGRMWDWYGLWAVDGYMNVYMCMCAKCISVVDYVTNDVNCYDYWNNDKWYDYKSIDLHVCWMI